MESFTALEPGDPDQVGQYRIVARLGAGGMGRVYLGRSRGGRVFAVKVIRPELAEDREFRLRFAREVAAARLVNGVYTAGVVDADPEGSPPWLATAYVPGVSLDRAVAEHGVWPEVSVTVLAAGLAEALEAIHGAGLVHRDLKPSNVLLAADGPRVIDFGISVAGGGAGTLTRTGVVVGTPGFMSPEQLTGGEIGPASDVFSLGAVLAFTAAATSPFGTGSAQGLMFRIVYEEPDLGAVPERLLPLVVRCLAKRPEDRPGLAEILDATAVAGGSNKQATLAFAGAGWLPEAVARVVRERGEAGGKARTGTGAGAADAGADAVTGKAVAAAAAAATPAAAEPPTASAPRPAPPRPAVPATPPPALPPPGTTPGFGPAQGQYTYGPTTPPPYGTLPSPFPLGPPPGQAKPRNRGPALTIVLVAVAAIAVVGLLAWLIPSRLLDDTAGSGSSGTPSTGPSTGPSTLSSSGPEGTPGSRSAPVLGAWRGNYVCTQGITGLVLTIEDAGGDEVKAVFSFFPSPSNPTVPRGSFAMKGTFRNGTLELKGDHWIERPEDYLMVDLKAQYDTAVPGHLDGEVLTAACSSFSVDRTS